jgi:hypothetical protein
MEYVFSQRLIDGIYNSSLLIYYLFRVQFSISKGRIYTPDNVGDIYEVVRCPYIGRALSANAKDQSNHA